MTSLSSWFTLDFLLQRAEASKLAPIGAASFLCNGVEQKDIAESGTGVSLMLKRFASKKDKISVNYFCA